MTDYIKCEAAFLHAFDRLKESLTADARGHVIHYVAHGELEMAYESFGLSVEKEAVQIPAELKPLLQELGLALRLNHESVFDPDFWERFSRLLIS